MVSAPSNLKTRLARLTGGRLDEAFRSGDLHKLLGTPSPGDGLSSPEEQTRWVEVPLVNLVTAGQPAAFTDLGHPARVADQYVRVPDPSDSDAFACRVSGDSMAPQYLEGDIVVFSPARVVMSGQDCFVRLEPDQDTTFKRAFFETDDSGNELIRLAPLNPKYPPKTYPREFVAALFAAVRLTRELA